MLRNPVNDTGSKIRWRRNYIALEDCKEVPVTLSLDEPHQKVPGDWRCRVRQVRGGDETYLDTGGGDAILALELGVVNLYRLERALVREFRTRLLVAETRRPYCDESEIDEFLSTPDVLRR
jgi:hypothetical protein